MTGQVPPLQPPREIAPPIGSIFDTISPALAISDPQAVAIPTSTIPPAFDQVQQVTCASCGGTGLSMNSGGPPYASCGACRGMGCYPGRKPCPPREYHTPVGRFVGSLYESLCCPDPCYEPEWVPAANAAFFVDYARPRTIQRFRWDRLWDLQFPDRSTYFWPRETVHVPNGSGGFKTVGAGGPPQPLPPKYRGEPSMNLNQISFYQEAAASPRASAFVEITYWEVNPLRSAHHSGFNNVNIGTKGMFFDTELLQLTFQFKTYFPIGAQSQGLSNGHISLEPSLLGSLKLAPDTYLQGQVSEWIPLGGDQNYQGSIMHYHGSLNHILYKCAPDSPIIGTLECSGWSFQDGAYTNPMYGPFQRSSGETYFSIGPGLRTSICNRVDGGGAISFPVTDHHWAAPWLTLELRILY